MILFGVVFVFSAVAGVISQITGPLTKRGRDLLESCFPQTGVDLDGSGEVDFYKPRHPVLYYSKKCVPHTTIGTVPRIAAQVMLHCCCTRAAARPVTPTPPCLYFSLR